jgi:DNA-binding transcriptional ArsR family regulator
MAVATVLQVLGDPSRQAILELLGDGERPVGELVVELRQSQPAVSRHLRVLRDAGLVASRADGQRRLYHVRPEPFVELADWLEPYRQLWSRHLAQLERHLEERRAP